MTRIKNRLSLSGDTEFNLYEEVELRSDHGELLAGSRGTVIDIPLGSQGACVAEFVDEKGATIAILDLDSGEVR